MAVWTKEEYKLVEMIAKSLVNIAREIKRMNENVLQVELVGGPEDEDDEEDEDGPIEVKAEVLQP